MTDHSARLARDRVIVELYAQGWSQREIGKHIGLSQPGVHFVLRAAAGRPRDRAKRPKGD
ncbi:hypothetical protein AWB92_24820 [Mycobacterium sp. IEC1808]|uniref:terminase gpP N-terminus-related DNA-binding protein n=1 Tax=Mycobacterium sp. IEC1808 TaxID=1743230 RepID=UPI000A169C7C|nr:hypothetical protein [Mycobacterium sp. IEC1808]ORW86912.1 hypothetical protein AWB92_24820 [Mycobacterium sp. IEC1808]